MGATHFLPSLVGHQIAARLLLTGEKISGVEALKLGLVAEAVDTDQACDMMRGTHDTSVAAYAHRQA
jgi:enoyl-CoA hydratase/carnithine racemase